MEEEREFIMIDVTDDPERMAEELIADSLPKTLLSEIDISAESGLSRLLVYLVRRRHQAAIEKEEILAFVEQNCQAISNGALQPLQKLALDEVKVVAKETGVEDIISYMEYFLENVNHLIRGHPELVDVKSDRLLWLIYALGLSLANKKTTYEKALSIINKPKYKQCISPLTLDYIIHDYIEGYHSPQEVCVECWMLLLDCALMIDREPVILAGSVLLSGFTPPLDVTNWLAVLKRCYSWIIRNGKEAPELEQNIRRIESRFNNRVSEDDF